MSDLTMHSFFGTILSKFNKSIWHRIGFSLIAFIFFIIFIILYFYFLEYTFIMTIIGLVIFGIHKVVWRFYDSNF